MACAPFSYSTALVTAVTLTRVESCAPLPVPQVLSMFQPCVFNAHPAVSIVAVLHWVCCRGRLSFDCTTPANEARVGTIEGLRLSEVCAPSLEGASLETDDLGLARYAGRVCAACTQER